MKWILMILLLSCSTPEEIQVESVCIEFKGMELSERNGRPLYIYHFWDEDNHTFYVEYSLVKRNYKVGDCVASMVRK